MDQRIIPIRERFRKRKRLVVFICTGNTCRSPMATGYFRKLLQDEGLKEVEVRSAGVMTITGLLPSQEAVQVMQQEGIDITRHRSSQLTPELIRKADLILAMTPFHRQTALRLSEAARPKTYLLKEFTRSDLRNVQIADPMGSTLEVFKKCFKEIKNALSRLVQHDWIRGESREIRPLTPEMLNARKASARRKSRSKGTTGTAKTGKTKTASGKKGAAKKAATEKRSVAAKTKKKSAVKQQQAARTTSRKSSAKSSSKKAAAKKSGSKKASGGQKDDSKKKRAAPRRTSRQGASQGTGVKQQRARKTTARRPATSQNATRKPKSAGSGRKKTAKASGKSRGRR